MAEHSHGIITHHAANSTARTEDALGQSLAAACCHDLSRSGDRATSGQCEVGEPAAEDGGAHPSRNYEQKAQPAIRTDTEGGRNLAWADSLDFGLYALEKYQR